MSTFSPSFFFIRQIKSKQDDASSPGNRNDRHPQPSRRDDYNTSFVRLRIISKDNKAEGEGEGFSFFSFFYQVCQDLVRVHINYFTRFRRCRVFELGSSSVFLEPFLFIDIHANAN